MKRTWVIVLVFAFVVEVALLLSSFLLESSRHAPAAPVSGVQSSPERTNEATSSVTASPSEPFATTATREQFATSTDPQSRRDDDATPAIATIAVVPSDVTPVGVRPTEIAIPSERSVTEPGGLVAAKPLTTSTTTTTIVLPEDNNSALTRAGILALVNAERAKVSLPPLSFNATLTVIAEVKTLDMITRAYFAHESPDGVDIAGLADRYHYDYLNIGENLAMGDFVSDADVMSGWMNSPGHRANILNPKYTEIGIAAIEGMNDGRMMWYAVQEFGRPASLCPKPDAQLAASITRYEDELNSLETTLTALREALNTQTLERSTYNAKVDEYNALVSNYNTLISTTKAAIARYNMMVEAFNSCISL